MREQGSYSCHKAPFFPPHVETKAEADVSRVRCSQDHWMIRGERFSYQRIFYREPTCETVVLGTISLEGAVQRNSMVVTGEKQCKLTRMDVDWIAEKNGKCLLNQMSPGVPGSPFPAMYSCQDLLPSFCRTPLPVSLEYADPDLKVSARGYVETCARYAEESPK